MNNNVPNRASGQTRDKLGTKKQKKKNSQYRATRRYGRPNQKKTIELKVLLITAV